MANLIDMPTIDLCVQLNDHYPDLKDLTTKNLMELAAARGHTTLKFKFTPECVILTSPPCHHLEAPTVVDVVAKLLIRSATRPAK